MVITLPFGIYLMPHLFAMYISSVVHSGFLGVGRLPIIRQTFLENCMDIKFGRVVGSGIQNLSMCRRAVSGIPSDGNHVSRGAIFVARKSYYNEEYSVYLCGWASLLSLMAVCRFVSYSVQHMFGAIIESGYDRVGVRSDDGG